MTNDKIQTTIRMINYLQELADRSYDLPDFSRARQHDQLMVESAWKAYEALFIAAIQENA